MDNFEKLYREYFQYVHFYLLRLCGDRELAEELTQETFFAALAMVYCGLTGDTTMNPWEVAQLAENWGYYVSGQGSSWNMMDELAEHLGLSVHSVSFDRDNILYELLAGNPIICIVGPGDFTTVGHFIVLTGVDEQGMVTVHDPNSWENSERKWDIETIMSQTQNLWGYENE